MSLFPDVEIPDDPDDVPERPVAVEDVHRAVVTGTDWTTETVVSQMRRGNIQLNPRFQRRDAWDHTRKSKFIESLMLGLPIPQLVLAEDKRRRGSFIVLDGKQRLLSLRQFSAREGEEFTQLRLRGLDILDNLAGLTLDDLEVNPEHAEQLGEFLNQPIRTVVVRAWPDEEFLNLVFLRLNTGSVQLSPQELRQALNPGDFTDFLDGYAAESRPIMRALRRSAPDFRMRDVELLLRYFGINTRLGNYRGDLKKFLDGTTEHFNKAWKYQSEFIQDVAESADASIETAFAIFEDNAFFRWEGNRYERRFNRAVFDVLTYYFKYPEIAQASLPKAGEVERAFQALCIGSDAFRQSIQTTTKSIGATFTRLALWGNALAEVVPEQGIEVDSLASPNPKPMPNDGQLRPSE